jgi:hypothetical protein
MKRAVTDAADRLKRLPGRHRFADLHAPIGLQPAGCAAETIVRTAARGIGRSRQGVRPKVPRSVTQCRSRNRRSRKSAGAGTGREDRCLLSIRNDPLARLHSHRQIDEAQYQARRAFQSDWQKAGRGPHAVDPTREYDDGGQSREPITEGQRKAVLRFKRAERERGADGSALVHDVLVQGLTMEQIGQRRGCVPNAGATISQGDSANVSTGWRCCMGLRRSILFPSKPSSAESQRLHHVVGSLA